MELVKCCEFVYEISVSLAWLTHTGSKKSCLSKRPAKAAQWGLVCEQGSVSLLQLRKPHTGPYRRDCGDYPALRLLVFGISSFSGPIPKVLFFVFMRRSFYTGGSILRSP